MTQKRWIARAGRGLLDVLKLLLRGAGVLCAAFGSLMLTLMSHYNPDDDSPKSYMDEYDPMKPLEDPGREVSYDEAEEYGWKSW